MLKVKAERLRRDWTQTTLGYRRPLVRVGNLAH